MLEFFVKYLLLGETESRSVGTQRDEGYSSPKCVEMAFERFNDFDNPGDGGISLEASFSSIIHVFELFFQGFQRVLDPFADLLIVSLLKSIGRK